MKNAFLIISFLVSLHYTSAQTKKHFKHLIFRETPYSNTRGRIPLTLEEAQEENHFTLTYDESDRVILIEYKFKDKLIPLDRSGILDGKRALASKTKIEYKDNKEIRTFYNINNKPTTNGMGVYKEEYQYDKSGNRKTLKYYNEKNEPINNSWKVHSYHWTQYDNHSVLEKRKNVKGSYVTMRSYYKFHNVLYKFNKDGILLSMNNVDHKLKPINDETGIAIDKAIYDDDHNLIHFKFFNAEGKPVIGSFLGTGGGFATYDDKGNCLKYATIGLDGNYMISKRSNDAYSKYVFDKFGNLIERSNYDEKGKILKRRNTYKVTYIYDEKEPVELLKTEFHHTLKQQKTKDSILDSSNTKIGKEKLLEDFNQLIKTLEKHPAQFQFINKYNYQKLVHTQKSKIERAMTSKEFYQIVAPIVSSLGCLHTRVVNTNFFRIPYKYWLPLLVWFKNGKMYAKNNCVENPEMTPGSEILEINGVNASVIYDTLKTTISADAFNEHFYTGDLNVNFLYYYHSFYGFNDEYNITFQPINAKKVIETTFNINEPAPNYKTEIVNTPRLNSTINTKESTALIQIKNFNFFTRGRQNIDYFKKTLDNYITEANTPKVKKVIFDLRGNRGGNPECTTYLLSYLIDKKVNFYTDNEINKNKNRSISVLPKKNNLSHKNIYILTNGRCASATSQMLAVIKYHKLATIIGEETGGTYSTFPGRLVAPLKNTKLALQLGTERETVSVPELPLHKGIIPDIQIAPSLTDIILKKDPLIKYIYNAK